MKKSSSILVVVLTLVCSALSFGSWLPAKINEQALLLAPKTAKQRSAPVVLNQVSGLDTAVSEELLAFAREERRIAGEERESGGGWDEIYASADDFPEMEERDIADPLADRFKMELDGEDYSAAPNEFAVPQGLGGVVTFWTYVFGVYGKDHVIFYNEDDVGIVYSVLDFTDLDEMADSSADAVRNQMVWQEKHRITAILLKLAPLVGADEIPAKLPGEERRILNLLNGCRDHIAIKGDDLKSTLVSRVGFAHRMRQAVTAAAEYMPDMRRIFTERGLPEELTVLPLFESAFNTKAYSKAGAAGVWQFIEATGKNYLRIDDFTDERMDPMLATYAAAAHLAREYRMFDNWPLTINGYNTGPGRMLKAVHELKTNDIAKIVKYFHGAGYGFDSRNYYPEFLAALEVYRNRHKYFPDLKTARPQGIPYEYVQLTAPANLKELFRVAGFDEEILRELNPALRSAVLTGQVDLPKGYLIKVPSMERDNVMLAAEELTMNRQYATYHVVDKGETLKEIASYYGVPTTLLQQANGILPGDRVIPGDVLKLPIGNDVPAVTVMRNTGLDDDAVDERLLEGE